VTESVPRSRRTPVRRILPWAIAALLLAGIGVPATAAAAHIVRVAPLVGTARPAANTTVVSVNLTDRPAFDPAALSTAEGTTLAVHLENVGNFSHTFTVVRAPDVHLNASWTPTQLDAFFRANGSLANVSVAPGTSAWANLSFNASTGFDTFEFVSVVPYQFQAGMVGEITISSTAPGLELSENTSVSGSNYEFLPNVLSANPAKFPVNLDVLVTNLGSFSHTFTLAPQSNVTLTVGNYSGYFAAHTPLVSANVPAGSGTTVWANFTIKTPGVYMYICLIPGHFAGGMSGLLYVGVPVPPAPPAPSTAIVEKWVLVGSGILLGVGLLIAALSALVGRFPPKPAGGHGH
jgi:uncharacterized cupredoxin-like copper-binding protein